MRNILKNVKGNLLSTNFMVLMFIIFALVSVSVSYVALAQPPTTTNVTIYGDLPYTPTNPTITT